MAREQGFRIRTEFRREDEAHVTVTGPVDRTAAEVVATVLRAMLDTGARQVLVDLAQVDGCDPALTLYLEHERRRLRTLGGWLVVDGSPATLRHDTATLGEIFRVYRHVAEPAPAVPPALLPLLAPVG
jgi:anti-anti-sigma regulatory factor